MGARNERRLVAVYCAKESGFEVIHGLLNRVMEVLGVPYKGEWIEQQNFCPCGMHVHVVVFGLTPDGLRCCL